MEDIERMENDFSFGKEFQALALLVREDAVRECDDANVGKDFDRFTVNEYLQVDHAIDGGDVSGMDDSKVVIEIYLTGVRAVNIQALFLCIITNVSVLVLSHADTETKTFCCIRDLEFGDDLQ